MNNCRIVNLIKEAVEKERLNVNNPRAMARMIVKIDSIIKDATSICRV